MHDVFISYKSEDTWLAALVRDTLEENGIPCWMAERDIGPGRNYAADIPKAIAECKVFLLVLTENAQKSPWIPKEIDLAISGKKEILPLAIGGVACNPTFTFLLTGVQCYPTPNIPTETLLGLIPKIRNDIAKAKNTRATGNFLYRLKRAVRYVMNELFSWTVLLLVVYGVLRMLGIDPILWLPEPARQTVLAFFNEHIRPLWETLMAWIRKASVA